MSDNVTFTSNAVKVKRALTDAGLAWLYEAAGELTAEVAKNQKK